ncbi:MAG: signal peptide peptidase SppA [Deltaproteobacteria bacterium]|nr:signal peptide peptidase SppA [Deltaproteobacteria bacterium]MBW2199775.1 signal peptide peptidase SppA [Deltaproteobacteria bacterium]MBW2538513.1 signal peptide peptidase SppA [Deltaproteobacteria bacterium]
MFSRRHPYLFFFLIFSSIVAVVIVGMSVLLVFGFKRTPFEFGEKVGIIELNGMIVDSKDVIQYLKRFREDDSIKAIVIRVDSPGGGVGPSQEIFREIRKTIPFKKVVTSMGAVAASGGYYIAAGTDGIVANPGTITGSIGVIIGFTNFQELLDKIGLVPVVFKSGKYKDTGSPVRKMTEAERKILQNFVDTIHKQFVMAVVEGRKMDQDKVESLADGRIFSGEEAQTFGLVDRLGNLEDAIEWAGQMGGIKGKISTVYAKKKKISLMKYILDSSVKEFSKQITNPYLYSGYLYSPGS